MSEMLASEIRDSMRIDWDVAIPMDDGNVLRADVFRPIADGKYPVLMTYGPYGKWVAFQEGYQTAWEIMCRENPDAVSGTSNRYANWEVVDPEKWVPHGYVCIRVDSRGRDVIRILPRVNDLVHEEGPNGKKGYGPELARRKTIANTAEALRRARAAAGAFSEVRNRIAAHPSGLITE